MPELKKLLRGHEDFYGNWHPLVLDTIILGQLALCHILRTFWGVGHNELDDLSGDYFNGLSVLLQHIHCDCRI